MLLLRRFFRSEPAAAVVLFCAAILAMLVANSPLNRHYQDLLHQYVLGISVHHWINDGLMAMFFLLVGLEIKHEVLEGALSSWRARALPGLAAIGGMAAPAVVFLAFNADHDTYSRGWAIPAATDIAFAIGVLSLLGSRVPPALRVLLVGIAIIDDLGAILIIALFYSSGISMTWLGLAALAVVALVALNRLNVYALAPYMAIGAALWLFVYQSGLHATLAGVILAFAIPAKSTEDQHRSPMRTTEHALDRWVSFGIVPIFGFANAGIPFSGLDRSDVVGTLPVGIALGLLVGKQVGVFGAIWLALRFRLAPLPPGIGWVHLYGVSLLCGIGFTMSLFIGGLAFGDYPDLMNATRIGVIGGSVLSATIGALVLRAATRQRVAEVSAAPA